MFQLNEYELMIASQLVEPSQLTTSWRDVAGLSSIIQELRETLILPIQQRNRLQNSKLIQPPKGERERGLVDGYFIVSHPIENRSRGCLINT